MEKKWKLEHGCHRGTLISRDTGNPEYFDTKGDALQQFQAHRNFYHSIGYQIWFAYLTSPDGEKVCLESNPYI